MNFLGLGGGGGLQVSIKLHPNPVGISTQQIIPLSHTPEWKVGKNPFSANIIKKKLQQVQPNPPPAPPQFNQYGQPMNPMGQMDRGGQETVYAYHMNQDIEGMVCLYLPPGKTYDHLGIKVQFLGRINLPHASFDGRSHYDFISLVKELYPPGKLCQSEIMIPFQFRNVEKQHETYHGKNVSIKYLVRVIVERKFLLPIKKDAEVLIQVPGVPPTTNPSIKMEVGIEECLHIEFEYQKRCYHLQDCIVGNIHFILVRIKIKYMELTVIRRESCGDGLVSNDAAAAIAGPNIPTGGAGSGDKKGHTVTETQTLTRYEIMDGAPVKGEKIPVKLWLGGIPADLTPTIHATYSNRFSVRYYLNLVLVDDEDRRYFKQQEIILWRKDLG